MNKIAVAKELARVAKSLTAANRQEYKGYTIEKSGANFYVTDPSGHRAFGEVPASIEIAKKWIDLDIREKGTKADSAERVAKSMTASISTLNMADIFTDYETQALDRMAKRECEQFAREVSKAVADNRDHIPSATPVHAKTVRVAMVMDGRNYFAQSDLVTPTWSLRLFFSQDNWQCYAVIMQGSKRIDSYTDESPSQIGMVVARRVDELGLQ